MKYVKCELPNIAVAALILGVFSISLLAKADGETPKNNGPVPIFRTIASEGISSIILPSPAASTVVEAPAAPVAVAPAAAAPALPAPVAAAPQLQPQIDPNTQTEEGEEEAGEENELEAAQPDGMNMQALKKATRQRFSVDLNKAKDGLVFSGTVPRKCAKGAKPVEMDSTRFPGSIGIKIDMPACPNGIPKKGSERDNELVKVSGIFPELSLNEQSDGKICIVFSADSDHYECEAVMKDGKPLEFTSKKTLDKRAEDTARAAEAKRFKEEQDRKNRDLNDKLQALCKERDFTGISLVLEELDGDTSKVIKKLGDFEKSSAESAVKKAKDVDAVKEAYEAYLSAAEAKGWDTEDMNKVYTDKRVDLLKEQLKDTNATPGTVAGSIRDLVQDLTEIGTLSENKEQIAWSYSQLAINLKDAENYDEAERYFEEAKRYSNKTVEIESAIAKMYSEAKDACLAKVAEGKATPGKCDSLAKKAMKHMDKAIAAQGKKKGDGSLEDLMAMRVEKIQAFGQGPTMNVSGFGMLNMGGGSYTQEKVQAYQQGQQVKAMQQMMGGQGGSGSGTSFFK